MSSIRNLAIIAHVDHGKTTLIDSMFNQSGVFRENQNRQERAMDSNALEKERGITILAKCTSINYEDTIFNIVDTPGHADFGGEVERVLSMVDGVLLLVDAAEGPMPQTKFVLTKALNLGLNPIVVINKVDRPDARIEEVIDEILELFMALDANDKQLDFPILYASGRNGWASLKQDEQSKNLDPLFKIIKEHIPAPKIEKDKSFAMLATMLDNDPYLGRILTGKVYSGVAQVNMAVKGINFKGEFIEQGRITKLFKFKGVEKIVVDSAEAGDIIAIAGLVKTTVSDTICAPDVEFPIKSTPIDPPTMSITIGVNNSPLAGTRRK